MCILQHRYKMLTLGPRKDGNPNVKYFESAETLAALELVKQWLHKTVKKVSRQNVLVSVLLRIFIFLIVSSSRASHQQELVISYNSVFTIPRRQFGKTYPKATYDENTGNYFLLSLCSLRYTHGFGWTLHQRFHLINRTHCISYWTWRFICCFIISTVFDCVHLLANFAFVFFNAFLNAILITFSMENLILYKCDITNDFECLERQSKICQISKTTFRLLKKIR